MCTPLTLNICLMCHMQVLVLDRNKISDEGLTAFAKAVESGALASLETIWLHENPGDSAPVHKALEERKK